MTETIEIAGRMVGAGQPCFIIAEAGVNHNGDLNLAKQLIDTAADVGADLVKFQTFKADRLATNNAKKADYQTQTTRQHRIATRHAAAVGAHRGYASPTHCPLCNSKHRLFIHRL